MKKMLLIVGATAAVTVCAAMLDLEGTDRTVADVADLASYDGVTNSSATVATLTFNIADDQAYSKTVGEQTSSAAPFATRMAFVPATERCLPSLRMPALTCVPPE